MSVIAHREHALLAGDAEDRVVALGSSGGGVDEQVDGLVQHRRGRGLVEHGLDVRGLEDLLIRVEGQSRQLALDQVGAILHDRLQLHVPVRALPARHQVQHVHAFRGLSVLDALAARELHADAGEQGQPRDLVPHPEQAGVEVDLGRERGDCDQARVPDEQEGRDCLVKEPGLDVRGLLEHDEVSARALRRGDLRDGGVCVVGLSGLVFLITRFIFSRYVAGHS